jgi:PPOX class probable F420-dependent enzyme
MESSMTDDLQAFLARPNVAVLATVDARGRPHAAPVWYLYEEGTFLISTGRGSQKHRNVERNPEVTLVIDRRTLPYYAVMAQGAAEIGPPPTDGQRRALATRYLSAEQAEAYLKRWDGGDSVTISLRPRRLIEYQGRAGR